MSERFEGVGVTPRELAPGTAVMVPVGGLAALANGNPCLIAWAVMRGKADEASADTDPAALWWLDLYLVPGGEPLPQMYRADSILGVPALGLSMVGVPLRPGTVT